MQDLELKASLSLSLSQSNYMFWNPSAQILSWTKLSYAETEITVKFSRNSIV